MDPNLFHIDWGRTFEALMGVVLLAFLIERVAALVFESRFFARNTKVPEDGSEEAIREQQDARDAWRIIETFGQRRRFRAVLRNLKPASQLWPPDLNNPELMVKRAYECLKKLRRLQYRRQVLSPLPLKELLAFLGAAIACVKLHFDVFSIIFLQPEVSYWGAVATGAVVAGGSKAAIRLFHDVLGVRSQAYSDMRDGDRKTAYPHAPGELPPDAQPMPRGPRGPLPARPMRRRLKGPGQGPPNPQSNVNKPHIKDDPEGDPK